MSAFLCEHTPISLVPNYDIIWYICRVVGRAIGRCTQDIIIGYREGVRKANRPKPSKHPYQETLTLEELHRV